MINMLWAVLYYALIVFSWFVVLVAAYGNLRSCLAIYKSLNMPWQYFFAIDFAVWAFIIAGACLVHNSIIWLAMINIGYNIWRWHSRKVGIY